MGNIKNELQLRYREYLESVFAIELLKHKNNYSSIAKISTAILKFIEANTLHVENIIKNKPEIVAELSGSYYGAIFNTPQQLSSKEILSKIVHTLKNDASEVKQIMQIQAVFIHRIYDALEQNPKKLKWVDTLFPKELFSGSVRGRSEVSNKAIKPTQQQGIARLSLFKKRIESSSSMHVRAIDRFTLEPSAPFIKSANENALPLVSGPSGHTGSFMLGAKLYGDLTSEELAEYALLVFAFLAAGGNHSFHEVMVVAEKVGVAYQLGNYADSIPSSIAKLSVFQSLSWQFPELRKDNNSGHHQHSKLN